LKWKFFFLQILILPYHSNYSFEIKNYVVSEQTKPEFSSQIAKSSLVVSPVAIEIFTAVLTSLKHLNNVYYIIIIIIIIMVIIISTTTIIIFIRYSTSD